MLACFIFKKARHYGGFFVPLKIWFRTISPQCKVQCLMETVGFWDEMIACFSGQNSVWENADSSKFELIPYHFVR